MGFVQNHSFNYSQRQWYSLPARMGGLGIIIPSEISDLCYKNSKDVTKLFIEISVSIPFEFIVFISLSNEKS